ncbi:MAG TPA: energy transducer TonB [Cyclobacteriaceae bacterium]|nr:energy transducer TonB [Cyclobacteriaceae bacterium]
MHENNTGRLPVLLGGMSKYTYFLASNLRYPAKARENEIEGTVITITTDGYIIDEKVEGEAGFGLGDEALRVVQLLPDDWIPLAVDGKPVATRMFIPIRFILP